MGRDWKNQINAISGPCLHPNYKKKKSVKEIISKNLLYSKGNSPQYSVIPTGEKIWKRIDVCLGFPGGSDGKESTFSKGDLGLIPGRGRSPGEGNGYLFQYSFLENSMDRGAWGYSPWGHKESDTTEQFSYTDLILITSLCCTPETNKTL